MRGQFDNSVQWLDGMPPSVLSTEGNAVKFADALEKRTGVSWIVKLVEPGRPNAGGFFISPLPKRLVKGRISPQGWGHLRRLFGALPTAACRWYLFPDELVAAFAEMGLQVFSGRVADDDEKKDSDLASTTFSG